LWRAIMRTLLFSKMCGFGHALLTSSIRHGPAQNLQRIRRPLLTFSICSYEEVKHGAPEDHSYRVTYSARIGGCGICRATSFRVKVLSVCVRLLPCRGPVDLWLNHQFRILDVCATRGPSSVSDATSAPQTPTRYSLHSRE